MDNFDLVYLIAMIILILSNFLGIMIVILYYKRKDESDFNEPFFQDYALNLIKGANEALLDLDIERLKEYESNTLYNIHKNEIETAKYNGELKSFIFLKINKLNLIDYKKENEFEKVICKSCVQTKEIIVDVNTKVRRDTGNVPMYHFMKFEFIRNKNQTLNKCPNCGAKLENNYTTKCYYCNSIINNPKFTWVLNKEEEFVINL